MISTRSPKKEVVEIVPTFKILKSKDLMIRGGDFYAIWMEDRGLWSTEEDDAIYLIDREIEKEYLKQKELHPDKIVKPLYLWNSDTGMIDKWHKYCQKQCRDWFVTLDENLIFSNNETNKKDYASKRLNYPLEPGECKAWDKLISTLYTEEERHKIEWAIGAIVTGDSKDIQKFMVLYGGPGTGKSTILNVIQQLFEGYYSVFDARALGSTSNSFALEAFKTNPLVAIQHDGDLSKIEDNTRLNSVVSHELMTINEKFKSTYANRFKCFLFMGTNKPVKITDGKSGIIRRLIDVSPSGNKLTKSEYNKITKQIKFELGAIAHHCKEVYLSDPGKYDNYTPTEMMGASNDFYNFLEDSYSVIEETDSITLKAAWEMYKTYCEEAKVNYSLPLRAFKEELKTYFWDFDERAVLEDGTRVRNYYSHFRSDQYNFGFKEYIEKKPEPKAVLIEFEEQESIFDKQYADCFAQYATANETPSKKWDNTKTKLSGIDTSKLHYVKTPEQHIVIDFDIPGEDGKKDFKRNVEEASKWPPTYAELSKSGAGVHLHYLYSGDVSKLSRVYDDHIEVKVFSGKSSLRRKLTKCNNLPIATISSGLPLKGDTKMVDFENIKSEKWLRIMIKKNLNKEIHPATKPSIDFIHHLLDKAYKQGLKYDVSDLQNAVLAFAMDSTNQSDTCIKLVSQMKFKSEEPSVNMEQNDDSPIVFYDVEVFPNLFLVNWKVQGEGKPVVRMINPKPVEIERLLKFKLVGFNNRNYDNHMLYACLMGYTNEQLYNLSTRLVSKDNEISRKAKFGEAFNLSYTDVYDFASAKQGLKKWEIELGIHHQELGLPWDEPVPEERWIEVAEYCDNDVIATEIVFDHLRADFIARQILADIAGGTVNDTTNTLSTRFIFGTERNPQNQFNYRFLADPVKNLNTASYNFLFENKVLSIPFDDHSVLPYFPGYTFDDRQPKDKSVYRGEVVGEGGYVYAEPGIHGNIALLDVASMHPASLIAEVLFGAKYTKRFMEIRDARVAIKHKAFEMAREMLEGKLVKYLDNDEYSPSDLAQALKIVINSVYGLTAAKFPNAMKDPRNLDNIVAKRGALFMIDLKNAVQKQGFTVVHVKTDSIKIAEATPEIIQFVMDFGKRYGYTFEHEATYDKMCLVNDAVYIAKEKDGDWTATGTQFAVPYVFKTLFSKEPIEFKDLCEVKQVQNSAIYLDMNANLTEDEHDYRFVGRVGNFCPVKPECGGELVRSSKADDGTMKFSAVVGTKGYRWMEAEAVRETKNYEKLIDKSYYNTLVDKAVEAISKYGDAEWFMSDEPYEGSMQQITNNTPF